MPAEELNDKSDDLSEDVDITEETVLEEPEQAVKQDELAESPDQIAERIAVNPKTGKQRIVEPGGSLPNGWQWA